MVLSFMSGLKAACLLFWTRLKGFSLGPRLSFLATGVTHDVLGGFLVARLPQPAFSSHESSLRSYQEVNTTPWRMPSNSQFPGGRNKMIFSNVLSTPSGHFPQCVFANESPSAAQYLSLCVITFMTLVHPVSS